MLANARQTLFARREQRIAPARDDKILTEWNGLMIHALAECGVVLERDRCAGGGAAAPPTSSWST